MSRLERLDVVCSVDGGCNGASQEEKKAGGAELDIVRRMCCELLTLVRMRMGEDETG